jgi:AcrR family transcriptional regulator
VAKINKDLIIKEAISIGNNSHFGEVTPALIAKNLKVTTPAIYKHFKSKDALKRSVSLKALEALYDSFVEVAFGKTPDEAIKNICFELRRFSLENPCYFYAIQKAPSEDDSEWFKKSIAVVGLIEKSLEGKIKNSVERIHYIRFMRSTLSGFIETELSAGFGLKVSIDTSFKKTVENLMFILTNK